MVTRTGDSSVTEFFKSALMRTDSLPRMYDRPGFRSPPAGPLDGSAAVSIVEWPPQYQSDSSPGPVITIEGTLQILASGTVLPADGRRLVTRVNTQRRS